MVTTRGGSKPSADPMQRTKPRKFRKTDNTATSPMILDPSAKSSTAAIANDSTAQSSRELQGLPEPHSDGHEHANASEPDNANEILDADVDADGKTINAETHGVEDSATNVSGQDATDRWSAINVAEIIPLGSTEPSFRPGVSADVSCSSEKQGLTPSDGLHLSKAQRPAKLGKADSTKDGNSVMHAPKADSTPASLSLSPGRYRVSKKAKSLLQPKRSATNHVTTSGGNAEKNQYKRCKKNALQAQIDRENFWMNCSMDYMMDALKINNALSKQYEEDVATSKKRRNELEESLEEQRRMIKNQGDILEDAINYIILCGARELKFTRRWGGV